MLGGLGGAEASLGEMVYYEYYQVVSWCGWSRVLGLMGEGCRFFCAKGIKKLG